MTLFQRLSSILTPPPLSLRDEVASTEEPPTRPTRGEAYQPETDDTDC